MPNKRSRRKQSPKFYCPYCNHRLWRVGSPKYSLFYHGKLEIQKHLSLTPKKASFLAAQSPTLIDSSVWLEEFFCEEHGKLWMHVSRAADGLNTRLATRDDWQRTTRTPDPELPNSTVSEFTQRMSRRASPHLAKKIPDL